MKLKTLIILLILAVLLAGLAYYSVQKKKPFSSPSAIGSKILSNLPVNRVGKIVITSKDGVTTVSKSKEKWVVASRFNYPASFDKVADMIRELSELKVGQTVNVNPSQLGSFNLVSPGPAPRSAEALRPGEPSGEARAKPGPTGTNTGTLVELRDEKDGFLASLLIGKGFMRQSAAPPMEMMNLGGYSDGQYVQTFDGKVYLVSRTLARLTESSKTWLADDFINTAPSDLKEITVSGPDRAPIKLVPRAQAAPLAPQVPRDGDSFTLADLRPEEGSLESSKVSQMTGALNRLGFDDVADPALTMKETGLDRPIIFRATTKDGLIYRICLGNTLTNDSFDRYLAISVTNEPAVAQLSSEKAKPATDQKEDQPAAEQKNVSKQAAELNGKFGSWIYVIKSYRAEPMLLTRDDLIKKPEPAKTEDSSQKSEVRSQNNTGEPPWTMPK